MPRLSVPGEPPHPAAKVSDYQRCALTERLNAPELSALAIVALGLVALSFAGGGYSSSTVAIATLLIWIAAVTGLVMGRGFRAATPAALYAGGCLAAFGALAALSMAWANDAGRAFAAAVRIGGYVGLFVAVIAWAPRVRSRTWLAGIAVAIGMVALASLAGRFDPSLFGGSDRGLYAGIPGSAGRLSYPIGYWNGLASLLALGVVLSLWWGAHGRLALTRAAAVASLPVYGLALYLTSSRGGVGEAVVGAALLVWLDRRRAAILAGAVAGILGAAVLVLVAHGSHDLLKGLDTSSARSEGALMACLMVGVGLVVAGLHRRLALRVDRPGAAGPWRPRVVAVGGVVALLGLIALLAKHHDPGTTASPGQRDLLSSAGSGRYEFWGSAIDAFSSSPLKGVGAGNWELYWNIHPKLATVVHNAHSLYLETLAEVGPVGLALLAAFLALAARAGWKRLRDDEAEATALFAVLVAGALSAGVDWTFQLPAVFAPVVIAAALLVCRRPEPGSSEPRRGPGRVPVLVVAVAGWVAGWAAATTLVANHHLASSHDAAARGDLAAAAAAARAAADTEPFSAQPRIQLALVEQAAGDLRAAGADARAAIRLASQDWQGWFVAFRISARAGNRRAAATELAVAQALAPVALPPK